MQNIYNKMLELMNPIRYFESSTSMETCFSVPYLRDVTAQETISNFGMRYPKRKDNML